MGTRRSVMTLLYSKDSRFASVWMLAGDEPAYLAIPPLTEIVGPVVYLASDASSYVTVDEISVSGGMAK